MQSSFDRPNRDCRASLNASLSLLQLQQCSTAIVLFDFNFVWSMETFAFVIVIVEGFGEIQFYQRVQIAFH